MSESQVHLGYLDGWRGIAISAVLIGHFFPLPYINIGRMGVELFFVLSGRLMADILFVKQVPLKEFYWRRFSRIYPGLLFFVFGCLILLPIDSGYYPSYSGVLAALSFSLNYLTILGYGAEIFDHVWSLCIEEHSYLLLGALAAWGLGKKVSVHKLLLLFVVFFVLNGVVQTLLFGRGYYEVYWRTDVRAVGIFFAGALYLWRFDNPRMWAHVDAKRVFCAFMAGLVFSFDRMPDPLKYSVGSMLFAYAVVFVDRAAVLFIWILEASWLRAVGLASFSIYLWQQPIYKMGFLPSWAGVLVALFVGFISYNFVEKPCRKFLNTAFSSRLPVVKRN